MDLSKSGNLKQHYTLIGKSLLELESQIPFYNFLVSKTPSCLQSNIAFVPTEVLESYLEDLLDFSINDEKLCINKSNLQTPYYLLSLLGLLLAVIFGLQLAYSGATFYMASSGVLLIALPSALVWHLSPKIAPNRRLFFAKILSQEIDRRTGNHPDKTKIISRGLKKFINNDGKTLPEMTKEQFH